MSKKKMIFVGIFVILSIGLFYYTVQQDDDIAKKAMVKSDSIAGADPHLYYMKFENNQIVIYNQDHTVYEFTDLEKDFLPVSLLEEIQNGKYFKDQQELYEFLETYTS